VFAQSRWILSLLLAASFVLAGCDSAPAPMTPSQIQAAVGTRAFIKRHGQEIVAEITNTTDKLVTTEFHWHGEMMAKRHYYRGLYPVAGTEYGYQFEMDFDEQSLEQLFPMAVGKEVSFNGNLKIIDRGAALDAWVHLAVVGEKTIDLSTGSHHVFVVDIMTEYRKDGVVKRKTNVVYYAPDLSMLLKSVVHEDGQQSYWRVVSVEQPGAARVRPINKNNKSGTVMI